MHAIYKYPIPVKEKYQLDLPKDARIIRVEDVDGHFFLWAAVNTDPEWPTEKRFLEFYKTGQPIETPIDNLVHLGNCKLIICQELCLYVFENVVATAQERAKHQ